MFQKITLENGLRIVSLPMANASAFTILVLFSTGSKYEGKELNGISHLLEHMIFKGSKKRPGNSDIVKEMDRVGGIINAFTGKEYMGFFIKVDSRHFELSCDVLSDMIFNPLLPADDLEKEKRVIYEEINMIKDSPQRHIEDLFEELLYGDQPAGWDIAGTKESVGSVKKEDLKNYLESHFTAQNAIVCLAGGFSEDSILKIKDFFNGFKNIPAKEKNVVKEIQKNPEIILNFKETDQSHIALGVRAFDIFSPKKYALDVISVILGGNMSSRLFSEIREKRGLGYYIHTSAAFYTDTGYLLTQSGVDNNRTKEAIDVILKEYKKISEEKVPQEELQKAKENIKGHLYLSLETSDSWTSYLGSQEILTKKILTPEEECAMIDKVKAEDVLSVAKEIFCSEKLNLAVIGPFKDKEEFQQLLKF